MTTARGIFDEYAGKYWAAGLPVIPLWRGEKRPWMLDWQQFSGRMPTAAEQAGWLASVGHSNIGLPLGAASGLAIVDIDTEDAGFQAAILGVLPPSPWKRHGAKGYALAFGFNGQRGFNIKDKSGKMLVEMLSTGRQCVMPPSIHPDTGQPYTASGDLWDAAVLGAVERLPEDFEEAVRAALTAAGADLSISGHTRVSEFVSVGSRDVSMIGVAGHYAHVVLKGERTFKEAVDQMLAWKATTVVQVAGDDIDIQKGVLRIAQFLIRDVTGPRGKALPEGWDTGLTAAERTGFGFDVFGDEHTKWDFARMKAYLRGEFDVNAENEDAKRAAVSFILKRMVSAGLDGIDTQRLLTFMANASSLGIKEPALRRELKKAMQQGIEGDHHTEIAKAVLDEMQQIGPVVYEQGCFWRWSGSHWDQVENNVVLKLIAQEFGHMPAAKRQTDHVSIMKVMWTLSSNGRKMRMTEERGVNFANGFLGSDLVLKDHDPIYGCTYTLPYRYVAELAGGGREFDEFMFKSWGEDADFKDKLDGFQEAVASTLFGYATDFQRVFCLQGRAGSGKSQLLDIVTGLMPEGRISAVPPEEWGDRFLPAMMVGKLLNLCGELHESKMIDGRSFKMIVAGDKMTVQHKNGQPFTFNPSCAHWFSTNGLPKTRDQSQGFNRRWLMFQFQHKMEKEERVLGIGNKILIAEREAIVAWAVQAVTRLIERREYTLSVSHEITMEATARANNTVRSFLLESGRVELGVTDGKVSEQALYNSYMSFINTSGISRVLDMGQFKANMRDLSYDLGYRVAEMMNDYGMPLCEYIGVALVKDVVKGRAANKPRGEVVEFKFVKEG